MTMMWPWRLITRHRSHMGLTDGLTFIGSYVFLPGFRSWAERSERVASTRCLPSASFPGAWHETAASTSRELRSLFLDRHSDWRGSELGMLG